MEALFFVAVIILGLLLWIGAMDKSRITDYIQERGRRIVSINWAPFGKGWFGEKEERIHEVVYYDHEGNQHFATCKMSLFTGVYRTEDRVTHRKAGWYDSLSPRNEPKKPLIGHMPKTAAEQDGDELERLRAENARLCKELEEKSKPQT